MTRKIPFTQKELKEIFYYDSCTGELFNRIRRKGIAAYSITSSGYLRIGIGKDRYLVHRLIWLYVYGELPINKEIDHINHNRMDNRICNLRLVTHMINISNSPIRKNNKSGCTGIYWNKKSNKWHARIKINYKYINLGFYNLLEDAIKVRRNSEVFYNRNIYENI